MGKGVSNIEAEEFAGLMREGNLPMTDLMLSTSMQRVVSQGPWDWPCIM